MDLDQAEPAGIVDDPDRLSLTDTTTSSYRADDDGSWAHPLLRRGWDLSRKAAIAGAAATAAPVVGPPLIVLSAAGVVLSIPFAAYLASIAATNQLMGALLPSSPPQPYGNWDQEDGDLEEEFFDAPEEYGKEVLALGRWEETEEDTIKEGSTSLPQLQDPGVYEVPVPALSDEEVEGEFAVVEESGQESVTPNTGDKTEDGTTVEENGREEVPALGHWNGTEEESASVTLSPLSRDAGVSEVPVPVPALADEEKEGEFAVKDSGEESVMPNSGDKTEDAPAMEENTQEEARPALGRWSETEEDTIEEENTSVSLPPISREPPVSEVPVPELAYEELKNAFAVNESSQFVPDSGSKTEDGSPMEENKSTERETPWQGFDVSESVPLLQDQDNVLGSKGGDEVALEVSGQEPLASTDGVETEDGTIREGKVSSSEIPSLVPLPGDDDIVLQRDREGEFAVQKPDHDLSVSNNGDKPLRNFDIPEPSVPVWRDEGNVDHRKGELEVPVEILVEEAMTTMDLVRGEVVDMHVDIVAVAATETEVLQPSNLAGFESVVPVDRGEGNVDKSKGEAELPVEMLVEEVNTNTDLATGEMVDLQVNVIAVAAPETEVLPPSNVAGFQSPSDSVARDGVEQADTVAAAAPEKEVPPPSNLAGFESLADPVAGEGVVVQTDIVAPAVPESEVLQPSNLAGFESLADLMPGEVVGLQADIVAAAAPDNEDLQPSNLAGSEFLADPVLREVLVVQTDIIAAAAPENEDLQPSNLAGPESLADPAIGEVVVVQADMVAAVAPENEDLQPSNLAGSESLADHVREEVVVVQSDIVAAAVPESQMLPPSNVAGFESLADLVTGEVVEEQANIVVAAALESVVLPPSNLPAMESSADLVMGKVVDVQAGITATVSENEMLPPGNLVACVDLSTGEVVDVQAENVAAAAPESELLPPSILAACESPAAAAAAYDGTGVGISVMQDVVTDFGDVNRDGVERRFVTVAPEMSVPDDEIIMSSGSRPYISSAGNEMIDQLNKATGVCHSIAEDESHYTEDQLREQLDMIRTITGYRAAPSSTLEGELAGLYVFVGVEPPVESTDASLLLNLNAKLRFLKSIIGVD